jgi:hypothetical protein
MHEVPRHMRQRAGAEPGHYTAGRPLLGDKEN